MLVFMCCVFFFCVVVCVSNMKKTEDEEELKSVGHDKDTQMCMKRNRIIPQLKAVKEILTEEGMQCRQTSTARKKMELAGAVVLHNQYAPLVSCI